MDNLDGWFGRNYSKREAVETTPRESGKGLGLMMAEKARRVGGVEPVVVDQIGRASCRERVSFVV